MRGKYLAVAASPLALAIAAISAPAAAQSARMEDMEKRIAQQDALIAAQAKAIAEMQQTLLQLAGAGAQAGKGTATPSGTSPTAATPLETHIANGTPPPPGPPPAQSPALAQTSPIIRTSPPDGTPPLTTQTQADLAAQGLNGSIYGGLASITPIAQSTTLPRGFMPVPGTAAVFRVGGQLQLDYMVFPGAKPGEAEDLFYPRLINTDPTAPRGRTRMRMSPRDSRLNFDVRTPSPIGPLRAFVEFDFFGDIPNNAQSQLNGYVPRLRHLLVEIGKGRGTRQWLIQMGQTWSTFGDVTTYPNLYNGLPLGAVFVRQPVIRFNYWTDPSTSFAVALENPEGDIMGAHGPAAGTQFDTLPDLVASFRKEFTWGHLQFGGLLRSIEATMPRVRKTGYGITANGLFRLPYLAKNDNLRIQLTYGNGIGRYIGELGPTFDGFLGSDGNVHLNRVFAGNISYQHYWTPQITSNLGLSEVRIAEHPLMAADALQRTRAVSANIVYNPVPVLAFDLEIARGERRNVNDVSAAQTAMRFTTRYAF